MKQSSLYQANVLNKHCEPSSPPIWAIIKAIFNNIKAELEAWYYETITFILDFKQLHIPINPCYIPVDN